MRSWPIVAGIAGLALGLIGLPAVAQQKVPLRIGILTDMSGVFSDISGPGAVAAIKMAVDE